ncbi:MAG: hypothetical protein BWX69_03060 [Planctomycetes bacterium ADurb.Bin069]|nr:MAG: hypothetical protein BWX69_03060 [Planctomycetes bacterium ADurb.Bin069]
MAQMFMHRRSRHSRARRPRNVNDEIEVYRYHAQGREVARVRFREAAWMQGEAGHGIGLAWLYEHANHIGEACLFWPWSGFGCRRATIVYNYRRMSVARAMCFIANGAPPEPGMMALHSCRMGDYSCVNPCHLRWGTAAENAADRKRDGKGQRDGIGLSETQVIAVWEEASGGADLVELAGRYRLSVEQVVAIRDGETRAWLTALRRQRGTDAPRGMD